MEENGKHGNEKISASIYLNSEDVPVNGDEGYDEKIIQNTTREEMTNS